MLLRCELMSDIRIQDFPAYGADRTGVDDDFVLEHQSVHGYLPLNKIDKKQNRFRHGGGTADSRKSRPDRLRPLAGIRIPRKHIDITHIFLNRLRLPAITTLVPGSSTGIYASTLVLSLC